MGLFSRSLLLLMISFANVKAVHADQCTARVEHDGTLIQGSKIYTYWLLGHRPWRWATVSFRYKITYIDEANKERSLEGVFREIVSSDEEKYTEVKNARGRPVGVTLVKYSSLTCQK